MMKGDIFKIDIAIIIFKDDNLIIYLCSKKEKGRGVIFFKWDVMGVIFYWGGGGGGGGDIGGRWALLASEDECNANTGPDGTVPCPTNG